MSEDPAALIRWAQRVRPEKIRRLYASEAQGLLDLELLDEVFYAIYARCQSILECSAAADGQVKCPACGEIIRRKDLSNSEASKAELMVCPGCSWSLAWGVYLKTYQGKQLFAGGAGPALQAFVDGNEKARTPRDRLLLIDAILHAYHWELQNTPTRPVAMNMIAGNNQLVIELLLDLAYGSGEEEMRRTQAEWIDKTRRADERRNGSLFGLRLSNQDLVG